MHAPLEPPPSATDARRPAPHRHATPSRRAVRTTAWVATVVRRVAPAVAAVASIGLAGACSADDAGTPDDGAVTTAAGGEAPSADTPATSGGAPAPSAPTLLTPDPVTHLGLTWFSPPDDVVTGIVAEHWERAQAASSVGRVLTDWIEVEPERGSYRFDELDEGLADLVDAGLAPMVTIAAVDVSGTPFPDWLGDFEPTEAAAAYVSMVEAAAPTLRSHGVWLLAIANEPPLADDELDLDDFATFVEAVADGVDRLAPDIDVTFTFAGSDPFIDDPAIDRMIDAVDAFSVNHYCLGADLVRSPIDAATDRIDELVTRAGDLPVVFQEFGCPAGVANGSSDDDQLDWFDTAFSHIGEIEQVRAAFVFEFLDWSSATFELDYGTVIEPLRAEVGDEFVDRFESWLLTSGLVRADGTTRPAFDRYLTAAASLAADGDD